jgi:hypothetical protein
MKWFEVDHKGLAKLLERKGKEFIIFELVQNAWDERTTEVRVTLERIPGTRSCTLRVEDDNPEGFLDLSHAFTLFAESAKKGDATKRGRFNAGEKMCLALCDEAQIASTTGTIVFDEQGRHSKRAKTERGSVFTGKLKLTNEEMARCAEAVRTLIPPPGVATYYNGELLEGRSPAASFEAVLPTEVANAEGQLKATQRKTRVDVYEPLEGETAMLYELGLPVVETADRWHLVVMQKVPLNMDRDNVPPSYLAKVRALAVETMREKLTPEDANAAWVREAFQKHGDDMDAATVERLTALRFGDKRVAFDPSDPEANHIAAAKGYTIVHGGQMTKGEWANVRRTGALLPAGQVTPSPKPYSETGAPQQLLDPSKWSPCMTAVAAFATRLGQAALGCPIQVSMVNDVTWPFLAVYGRPGQLTFNLGRLGHKWFEGPREPITRLLVHEFSHHYESNHLSSEYHEAICRVAAKVAELALTQPELFELSAPVSA